MIIDFSFKVLYSLMETKNSPLSAVHVQHRPKKNNGIHSFRAGGL